MHPVLLWDEKRIKAHWAEVRRHGFWDFMLFYGGSRALLWGVGWFFGRRLATGFALSFYPDRTDMVVSCVFLFTMLIVSWLMWRAMEKDGVKS